MAKNLGLASNNTQNTGNQNWQATAFVNIDIQNASGTGKKRLGALPLKEAVSIQKMVIDSLSDESTRDEVLETLKDRLVLSFNFNSPVDDSEFALK